MVKVWERREIFELEFSPETPSNEVIDIEESNVVRYWRACLQWAWIWVIRIDRNVNAGSHETGSVKAIKGEGYGMTLTRVVNVVTNLNCQSGSCA